MDPDVPAQPGRALHGDVLRHADWYEQGRFSPFIREKRCGGEAGSIIEAVQPAGDLSDPPLDDLILVRQLSPKLRGRIDFGAGRFVASGPPGTLFLAPPQVATDIQLHLRHAIRIYGIHPRLLRQVAGPDQAAGDPGDFGALHSRHFEDPHALILLDRMWEEAGRADAPGRLYAESAAVALIVTLLRLAARPARRGPAGLAKWQVRRAVDYMDANLERDLGLPELAALVGLSPQHFCTAFRRSTGEPPHRWLTLRRMERAKALLADRSLGLTEVALAVGYGSQSAFGAAFRRVVGTAPDRWRRAQG